MKHNFDLSIKEHTKVINSLKNLYPKINKVINKICLSLKKGGKILICGNGGSASDAQHLVAELIVRLNDKKRAAIPALSLALDTSTITASANDLDYKYIFSRALEGLGKTNDILIVLSTSGNSNNIIEVLKQSRKMKIFSIGFLGNKGGKSKKLCNSSIVVDSKSTQIIQECHIFLGHFIVAEIEKKLQN